MAKPNVVINSVTYNGTPEVDIPISGGGTAQFYYTGDADSSANYILSGKVYYGASGEVTGNMANNGATGGTIGSVAGTITIPAGYTSGGSVSLTNVSDCIASNILKNKSILGVNGNLQMPTISQDGVTKVLSIS